MTREHDQQQLAISMHRRSSLGPADQVIIAYLTVIAALAAVFGQRVRYWWLIGATHAAVIAVILLWRAPRKTAGDAGGFRRAVRAWYPLVLVPATYKELSYLIPLVHPRDFDWELAGIDRLMFGVDPTVWLERVVTPVLTELFQLSYVTYYFLPLALGLVMWRKGWFERFHFLLFVIVLGFYLSYLGYIAVPAIGPRFILADRQSIALRGVLFFDSIRSNLDRAEGITRDCFPSGHVELTLLVLYYARRFHRRSFWWMFPPGSALIVSTVYLRYHYVIDVVAGTLLAVVVILVAGPLYRALGGQPVRIDSGHSAR